MSPDTGPVVVDWDAERAKYAAATGISPAENRNVTKDEAVAALRAAALDVMGDGDCGHTGLGADWNLAGAEDAVVKATQIAWMQNVFGHELAALVDGKVYHFDAQQSKHGAQALAAAGAS